MLYHHYLELAAFGVGLACYRQHWLMSYKLLLLLCFLTAVVEITGHYMWVDHKLNNNWLYNLFLPLQAFCFMYLFYSVAANRQIRRAQAILLLSLIPGTCIAWFFHRDFFFLNSYASTFYLVMMLISSGLFFIDAFVNEVDIPLIRQPAFWVAGGLLFFTLVLILVFALWNVIKGMAYYKTVLDFVRISSNTILYGGIISCYICLIKGKTSSMLSS